ncbi:MAG: hypothetical protein WC864_09770 [Ilumatobacteraceae bacterium]
MSALERIVTVKQHGDVDEPWRYWTTRPIVDRLEMVEELRREHHGWEFEAEPRLSRVYRVVSQA